MILTYLPTTRHKTTITYSTHAHSHIQYTCTHACTHTAAPTHLTVHPQPPLPPPHPPHPSHTYPNGVNWAGKKGWGTAGEKDLPTADWLWETRNLGCVGTWATHSPVPSDLTTDVKAMVAILTAATRKNDKGRGQCEKANQI